MAKLIAPRKYARKKQNEKENTEPVLVDAHNSILETIFEDINNVVGRRSDIGKRSLCLKDNDESITDADDEKEKRERKEKEKAEKEKVKKNAEIKKTGINILNNLTQAELEEHYSKCIQLCNQNKVNVKNAFKLQLIDYMKLICMKQPSKTENLTLMGCTLGASAKIYAHRVDKVYTDMVKIVSGKELEVEKDDSDEGNDENFSNELDDKNNAIIKRRKRKCSTDSMDDEKDNDLQKFDLDKMLLAESALEKKKAEKQPQDKPTLPVGIDYFLDCPVQEIDCRISFNLPVFPTYDLVQNNNTLYLNESHYNGNYESLDPCHYIRDYNELQKCFTMLGEKGNEELINSSLTFDPSSRIDLPDSIRLDADEPDIDQDDGAAPEGWALDYDDECLHDPEPSLSSNKSGQVSKNQPRSFAAPDMAKLVSSKSSDYSFFDNSRLDFWAGPSHWTIKRTKGGGKEQKVGGSDAHRKIAKKNSYLDFSYESFKGIKRLYTEIDSFTLARKTMLTWSKSRCKFPQDILFTQKSLFSLLKNSELLFVKKDSKTKLLCSATLNESEEETVLTPDDFSGDISHVDDDRGDEGLDDICNGEFEPDIRESISPLRVSENAHALNSNFELLPAPPKVNKITIKYAKAQKRVDVKLLKNTIWDSMAMAGKSKVETHENPVKFSEVFSNLPDKLPKEEAAELSFPIAFMALLHMANEKNLCLEGTDNYDDIYVSLD